STFAVPFTFTRQARSGSSHASATDDSAARCTTASAPRTACRRASSSRTSPSNGTKASPSSRRRCVPANPPAPVTRTRSTSVGAAAAEDGRDGLDQDRDVEPDRPVLEVEEVEPDEVVEAEVRAARDLPEAGHAGDDDVGLAVPGVEALVVAQRQRARADEAHLAAQHVPELRDLVEREPPQHGADRGHPRGLAKLDERA